MTDKDMKSLAIKRQMDSGYALTPQYIKNKDVSAKEMAVVSEHLDELPGVDVTSDWKRDYPYNGLLQHDDRQHFQIQMKDFRKACSIIICRSATAGMTGSEKATWKPNMKMFCRAKKRKSKNITRFKQAMSRERKPFLKGKPERISCLTIDVDMQKGWKKLSRMNLKSAKASKRSTSRPRIRRHDGPEKR